MMDPGFGELFNVLVNISRVVVNSGNVLRLQQTLQKRYVGSDPFQLKLAQGTIDIFECSIEIIGYLLRAAFVSAAMMNDEFRKHRVKARVGIISSIGVCIQTDTGT